MEKKTSKNILLAIMGVLIVVEMAVSIMILQQNKTLIIDITLRLISLAFTAFYGFLLYKKPHGNMLKYAMLIFALASILASSKALMIGNSYHIIKILASAVVCYCAGRLDRIDKNKYLMPIIGVAFIFVSVYGLIMRESFNFADIFKSFIFSINYITLMIAYFVRYDEHKEAGLIDAPKE